MSSVQCVRKTGNELGRTGEKSSLPTRAGAPPTNQVKTHARSVGGRRGVEGTTTFAGAVPATTGHPGHGVPGNGHGAFPTDEPSPSPAADGLAEGGHRWEHEHVRDAAAVRADDRGIPEKSSPPDRAVAAQGTNWQMHMPGGMSSGSPTSSKTSVRTVKIPEREASFSDRPSKVYGLTANRVNSTWFNRRRLPR